MKILKLENLNINLKLVVILMSLTLMLSSLSILTSQSIYSQTSEDAKSLNCKDNKDQSLYVRNVLVENNSDKVGPVTDDQDSITLKNLIVTAR